MTGCTRRISTGSPDEAGDIVGGKMGICISIVRTFGVKSNGTHSGGGVNDFLLVRLNFNEKNMTIMRNKNNKKIIPKIRRRLLNVSSFDVCGDLKRGLTRTVGLDAIKFSPLRLKPHEIS